MKPIIYSVLPRLWGNATRSLRPHGTLQENGVGKLSAFTPEALRYIRSLGATHVWYIGLLEHATKTDYQAFGIRPDHPDTVKGQAGSPYAVKDYYDVDPDLADDPRRRQEEFDALIQRTHEAGLQVLLDFIPNHVARCYASDSCPAGTVDLGSEDDRSQAFSQANNFYYLPGTELRLPLQTTSEAYSEAPARATGNDCFTATPSVNDWFETVKLNYGVDYQGGGSTHFEPLPDTWHKMYAILRYWAQRGVDGFRCDMTELVPPAFWAWCLPRLKEEFPALIFLAEIYQPHRYGEYLAAGFDYLYDKVGLYDYLIALGKGQARAEYFTGVRDAVGGYQGQMCYFLENHDEQRLASDFVYASSQRGWLASAVAALSGTNPFLYYFGQELGERGMDEEGFSGRDGRTTIFDYWALDKLQRLAAGAYTAGKLSDGEQRLLGQYQALAPLYLLDEVARGAYYGLIPLGDEAQDVVAYVRFLNGKFLLVLANFAPVDKSMRLALPEGLLSQAGVGNNRAFRAVDKFSGKVEYLALTTWANLHFDLPAEGLRVLHLTPLS